jgi:hypothetical protein
MTVLALNEENGKEEVLGDPRGRYRNGRTPDLRARFRFRNQHGSGAENNVELDREREIRW